MLFLNCTRKAASSSATGASTNPSAMDDLATCCCFGTEVRSLRQVRTGWVQLIDGTAKPRSQDIELLAPSEGRAGRLAP